MKLIPLKKFESEKIKNSKYETCISCSMFKMKKSYKPFKQYIDAFIKWVSEISPRFMVRLYIDESILQDESYKLITEKDFGNLEIYQYIDERFLDEDKIHHDGTFGMMPRFMALFDKELIDVYNIKYIWISDVDLEPQMFNYEIINNMRKTKCDVSYGSFACYERPWIPDTVEFPVINYRIIVKTTAKISEKDYNKFLDDVYKGKYSKEREEIIKYYSKDKPKTDAGLSAKYFVYGIDEIYTNVFVVKDLTKYKQLIYYSLSMGRFARYIDIPNEKKLYAYEGMARQGKGNLKFNINQLKKIHNELAKYLEKQDFKNLPQRLHMCFDDYKKYKNKIQDDLPEFMAILIRYPPKAI